MPAHACRSLKYFGSLHRFGTKSTIKNAYQLLHQRQPTEFTPYCRICRPRGRYRRHANPPTENVSYFIYYCPRKLLVWTRAFSTYIDPQLPPFDILNFYDLLHLRLSISRSTSVPFQQLSTYQVFACILQGIWSAHYRFVLDDVPFVTNTVLNQIHKSLHQLDAQETLHSLN